MISMNGAASIDKFQFLFVDTAVGGVENRNKVRDLIAWTPPADTADVFVTWLRFDASFDEYARTNPSPKTGRPPSVAGYRGAALAPFVHFDIDREHDLDAALIDLRRLLDVLEGHGVDLDAIGIAFSGMK